MCHDVAMSACNPYLAGVAERASFRLDAGLVAKMRRVADDRGLTQKDAWSQVIGWFVTQNESAQALILGVLPDRYKADAVRTLIGSIYRDFGQPSKSDDE
jgi:hypothetical protein